VTGRDSTDLSKTSLIAGKESDMAEVQDVNREFKVQEHASTYLKGELVYDPDLKKWRRGEQALTGEEFSSLVGIGLIEVLSQILTELKVQTYYLSQGLNASDEPDSIRNEITNNL